MLSGHIIRINAKRSHPTRADFSWHSRVANLRRDEAIAGRSAHERGLHVDMLSSDHDISFDSRHVEAQFFSKRLSPFIPRYVNPDLN
jgi:hypothetical protein